MWPAGQKCEQRQICSRRPSELCLQRAPPGGTMHIIAISFIIVENIITIIIIFMNVKKTSPPGPPWTQNFWVSSDLLLNSRLLTDILGYLGNGSNSDNLSKNLISGVSDHQYHHHHHPYSFSDHLNASLAEVGVEPAAEPILLVPLRLSMPDVESSYSVWFWKGCPPKASLGIWSVKGVPFNFVNASPFNTLYKGGDPLIRSFCGPYCMCFLAYLIITIW